MRETFGASVLRMEEAVQPETRYARLGQDRIAYQVLGHGPPDLVMTGIVATDVAWEDPGVARFLRTLASFSRVIFFDRRGSGASDPLPSAAPTWEDWADDILSVMDAAGSKRATLIGVGDSGPLAILFAATYPDRVSSLVLINTGARLVRGDDSRGA